MKKFTPQLIGIIVAVFFLVTFSYVIRLTYALALECFGQQNFNAYGALSLCDCATTTWGLIFAYKLNNGTPLFIAARNNYARDWLESRLSSTISRLLIGIFSTANTDVKFVVMEPVL